ncbi:SprT-like domain-containing protein [Wenyingzhuangia sp. IMCC45533]
MIEKITPYIPINAKNDLEYILNQYPFKLKIVKERKTKRGDFRPTIPLATITINNSLTKEQFLITLVHEIAHLHTYINYPKAKPHGQEWKSCFKHLMLPFLTTSVFDNDLLRLLAKHFINPKATTDSDIKLSVALSQLKEYYQTEHQYFVFDLKPGTVFELNNRAFKILTKRRTRYECLEISSNKRYLIKGNASVKLIS